MREIKFRAWNKNAGYIDTEFCIHADGHVYQDSRRIWNISDTAIESAYDELIIEQYTEILDKNRIDIYENDVVDIIHPCWTNRAIVKFKNGSFIFESISEVTKGSVIPGYTFMNEKWEVQVIGNIHENPELIKKGSE